MPREGTFTLVLTSLALAWSLLKYSLVTVGSNVQLIEGIYFASTGQRVKCVARSVTGETAIRDTGAAGGLGLGHCV